MKFIFSIIIFLTFIYGNQTDESRVKRQLSKLRLKENDPKQNDKGIEYLEFSISSSESSMSDSEHIVVHKPPKKKPEWIPPFFTLKPKETVNSNCIAKCPVCPAKDESLFNATGHLKNPAQCGKFLKSEKCNKIYLLSNSKMNWFNAYKRCCLLGMKLVSFESQEQFDCFNAANIAEGITGRFWTSGTDEGCAVPSKQVFTWCGIRKRFEKTWWGKYEPNFLGWMEKCVDTHIVDLFGKGKRIYMTDSVCTLNFNFACQADLPFTPTIKATTTRPTRTKPTTATSTTKPTTTPATVTTTTQTPIATTITTPCTARATTTKQVATTQRTTTIEKSDSLSYSSSESDSSGSDSSGSDSSGSDSSGSDSSGSDSSGSDSSGSDSSGSDSSGSDSSGSDSSGSDSSGNDSWNENNSWSGSDTKEVTIRPPYTRPTPTQVPDTCVASCPFCPRVDTSLFAPNGDLINPSEYGRWLTSNTCQKMYLVSIKNRLSWFNAFKKCCSLGMKLVSFHSQKEYDCFQEVNENDKNVGHFWTSGTDEGCSSPSKSVWSWCATNKYFTSTREGYNGRHDLKHGVDNCIELFVEFFGTNSIDYDLRVNSCFDTLNYVCEVPAIQLTTTTAAPTTAVPDNCVAKCPKCPALNPYLFNDQGNLINPGQYGRWMWSSECKKIYIVINNGLNWFDAYKKCCTLGMKLVSFNTQRDFNCFQSANNADGNTGHYWTSGTDEGCISVNKNVWSWCGSHTYFTTTTRQNYERLEKCIKLKIKYTGNDQLSYDLSDAHCSTSYNFVCEVF